MNMQAYRPAYEVAKRKKKSSSAAIQAAVMHPNLMRSLVFLVKDKVKLEEPSENPWYEEMAAANLTADIVKDAQDFVAFAQKQDERAYAMYRSAI